MSKISIIIPVYNVEQYLHRCIDSVLNQTFQDFEIIIVDDGSIDGSGKICDDYIIKDSRIHVLHKKNGGLSDARNTALDWMKLNSDSEWLTFLDSDDWLNLECLNIMYNVAINTKTDISICNFYRTFGDSLSEEYTLNNVDVNVYDTEHYYMTKTMNANIACAKLYRAKLYDDVRFPLSRIHEDEFTTYKVLFKSSKLAEIDAPLYYYFINPDSITISSWTPKHLDLLDALRERMLYFSENNTLYKWQVNEYIINIYKLYYSVNHYAEEKYIEKYSKFFSNLLRKELHRYRKTCDLNIKNNPWIFETAYPLRMLLYWKIKNTFKL